MNCPLDRRAIEAHIPHRAPFLFVDRVVDAGGDWIASEWDVPEDGAWFAGHYPGQPVLPGVLISEHAFQSAAVFVYDHLSEAGKAPSAGDVPVLTRILGARFRRICSPGETLATKVTLAERIGPAFRFVADVRCADERVARIEFLLTSTAGLAALGV